MQRGSINHKRTMQNRQRGKAPLRTLAPAAVSARAHRTAAQCRCGSSPHPTRRSITTEYSPTAATAKRQRAKKKFFPCRADATGCHDGELDLSQWTARRAEQRTACLPRVTPLGDWSNATAHRLRVGVLLAAKQRSATASYIPSSHESIGRSSERHGRRQLTDN